MFSQKALMEFIKSIPLSKGFISTRTYFLLLLFNPSTLGLIVSKNYIDDYASPGLDIETRQYVTRTQRSNILSGG